MRVLYLLLFFLYSQLSYAKIDELIYPDSILLSIKNSVFVQSPNDIAISSNDLEEINIIMQQYPDSIYLNFPIEMNVCFQLIDNYFNNDKGLLKTFNELSINNNKDYLENNLKTYISRLIFDLFYSKGNLELLKKEDVQTALNHQVINELLEKNFSADEYLPRLKFIANNSHVYLYNI